MCVLYVCQGALCGIIHYFARQVFMGFACDLLRIIRNLFNSLWQLFPPLSRGAISWNYILTVNRFSMNFFPLMKLSSGCLPALVLNERSFTSLARAPCRDFEAPQSLPKWLFLVWIRHQNGFTKTPKLSLLMSMEGGVVRLPEYPTWTLAFHIHKKISYEAWREFCTFLLGWYATEQYYWVSSKTQYVQQESRT